MSNLPYVGLRPFQSEDTAIFFGREQHTEALLTQIKQQHLIVLTGYSGGGKTSLINAGLIPRLQKGTLIPEGAHWKIAKMQPGERLFANLTAALSAENVFGGDFYLDFKTVESNPAILHEILAADPSPSGSQLLIICDQFEDIFRYPTLETAEFIKLLLASSKPYTLPSGELSNAIYVLLTLRTEFLDEYESFASLAEEMDKAVYQLPGLNREQLQTVIEQPALTFDGEVEPELVLQILEDADQKQVPLPLLQQVLWSLWSRSNDKKLTIFDYFSLGGLNQVLSHHAELIYQSLSNEQQRIAKTLFKSLLVADDKQAVIVQPLKLFEVAELANVNWQAVKDVVELFRKEGQGILLPASPASLSSDTSLDIAYDNFVRQWPRLKDWSDEETKAAESYALLVDGARNFQNNAGDLLRSPVLEQLWQWYEETKPSAAWAKRYAGNFDSAIDFLQKSKYSAQFKKLALFVGGGIVLAGIGILTFNALSKPEAVSPSNQVVVVSSTPVSQPPPAEIQTKSIAPTIAVSEVQKVPPLEPTPVLKRAKTASEPVKVKPPEVTQPLLAGQTPDKKALLALSKRFPNKIQLLQEYKNLNLKDPALWHKLGDQLKHDSELSFNHQKRTAYSDAAIEAYQKAIDLDAMDYKAWFSLGDIHRVRIKARAYSANKESNRELAIAAYNKVASIYPKSEWAFYYLGSLYQQQKKFDEAIENYKKQLKNTPKHKFAWQYLASAYQKQNKLKEAIEAYQQDLKINPHNAEAKRQLKFLLK
ncbi:MAG: tetratricopeptide repeat protein [Methylococcales bacterium]